MTNHYDFGTKASPAYDTHNPARPAQAIGCYTIPDRTEMQAIIARANVAAAEWARVPGLERGQRLDAFLDAVVAGRR